VSAARIARPAAAAIRAAVSLAGGREVCFVCTVSVDGTIESARVVARGDAVSVLALPGFAERGEMLVHNHPSGVLDPSDADLAVAARIFENGVGFAIVDNAATALYVVVEVPRAGVPTRLDPVAVGGALGPDGPVATQLSRYEDRASQRAMAETIATLFNDGGVGLLEAGTGVGKSLAYLVPALRWAAANGDRTIVSTNTINLQEQLVGKDLPFLAAALGDQPVRFALLKGWRNYLCLERLDAVREAGATLFDGVSGGEVDGLIAWAARTTDGSLADLPAPPRPELWDEVAAEPDLCQRLQCRHFSACFLFRARREAAQADVVVVNHHLLMSDVAVRRAQQNWQDAAVLPAYTRLVVDEGHHLEDAAAAHLGVSVTRRGLQRLFGRLERRGKGLLPALVARLSRSRDLMSVASLDLVEGRLVPSVAAARRTADVVFDLLEQVVADAGGGPLRLTAAFADHRVWHAGLAAAVDDVLREIELLNDALRTIRERHEADAARDAARDEAVAGSDDASTTGGVMTLFNEIRGVGRRLQAAGDGLRATLVPPPDAAPSVRWVELRAAPGMARARADRPPERNVAIASVPLDLAPVLRADLFERVRTAVVTSATLTAGGPGDAGGGAVGRRGHAAADGGAPVAEPAADPRFAFLARRLGVDALDLRPVTAVFPSPFRYERQALLVVPTDFPAPNVDAAGHFEAVVGAVRALAEAADGGLFVLCTSHRDVREVARVLRDDGGRWPLLVHGEDARDGLLRRFRESGRAILVGTASFWEGVDVPGDALRGLVLAKIPFRVPSEPVTAAHCEAIDAGGGNAFAEYMLPHASLRLKQGFGRLIRSATDRGVVIIADPRIATKAYGRELLNGLPAAPRLIARWATVAPALTAFYRPS
jgi:ATP-dependent DNA helicase DinG